MLVQTGAIIIWGAILAIAMLGFLWADRTARRFDRSERHSNAPLPSTHIFGRDSAVLSDHPQDRDDRRSGL